MSQTTETEIKPKSRFQIADEKAFLFFFNKLKNPVFDIVMPVLSHAGNSGRIWIYGSLLMLFIGVLLLKKPLLEPTLAMLAAMGIAEFVAEGVIKKIRWRDRPYKTIEGVELRVPARRYSKTSSFPSGHSAAYICSAVILSLYFHSLAPVFLTVGICGAYSRIYVGAHYPSDVAAGSLIGLVCAFGIFAVFHPYLWNLVVWFVKLIHLTPYLIH